MNIKAIRESMGLTREEFAALVPVDPVTVWRWEERGIPPHPVIHQRLKDLAAEHRRK